MFPFVYVPFATQCGVLVLWAILGRIYAALMRTNFFRRFVQNHLGNCDNPIPRLPCFMQCVCVGQIVASLWAVGVFVFNCYVMETEPIVRIMDGFLGILHAFHYFIIAMNHEFKLRYLCTVWGMVDVLTIPNMLLASIETADGGAHGLTLNFLRSLQALFSYERLDTLGAMHIGMGNVAHEIVLMIFRFMALIICFASSVFVLEVLGEVPFGRETLFPTAMGDISFFTMLYWVVETISTVGYGDFAPKTFLSRLTTMTFMIAGVAFFTIEINRITSIAARQKKGTGEYQKTSRREHLVLLGGGVRNVDTTLILAFLDELYHQSYRNSWPDLVVMSMSASIEKLKDAVELHLDPSQQQQITYLVGSPLRLPDLRRCRCDCAALCMIIADTTGRLDPLQEDKMNILRTLSLKTGFPRTPLRLMLLMSESKQKALSVGIREQRCFSLNDVRSGLLWTSCRCIGWNTMFSNIIVTNEGPEETEGGRAPWLENYLEGMDFEMYGFLAAEEFHGQPIGCLMMDAYTRTEGGVCVFAAQINGRIVLSPLQHRARIDENVVFFALAGEEESLNSIIMKSSKTKWKEAFARNRYTLFETLDKRRSVRARTSEKRPHPQQHGYTPVDQQRGRADSASSSGSDCGLSPETKSFREGTDSSETRPLLAPSPPSRDNGIRNSRNRQLQQASPAATLAAELEGQATPESFDPAQEEDEEQMGSMSSFFLDAEDTLTLKDVQILEEKTVKIRKNAKAAPFILLLDLSGSWMQVVPFILRSLTKLTPFRMPIVVISPASPPRSVVERLNLVKDTNIGVTIGNPVWAQDLLRAGVTECCVMVCLGLTMDPAAEEGGGSDSTEMLDADVVLLQRMLQLLGQDRKPVILEFKRGQNMRLLPSLGADENGTTWKLQRSNNGTNDDDNDPAGYDDDASSSCWRIPQWLRCAGPEQAASEKSEVCLDPRFASGQIFTPHVLGAMVACEYRMPGIIEMTHILMAPHPEQQGEGGTKREKDAACFLWQVRMKKQHCDATYQDVFLDFVQDSKHPALPLGILRIFDDARMGGLGYVWTNPAPSTVMLDTDLIFVLADNLFGKAAYEQGLLPFSGRAQDELARSDGTNNNHTSVAKPHAAPHQILEAL